MAKRRRTSAPEALGQQAAELRRSARGRRFVGEDAGAAQARAAERAKVTRMQRAAREVALRAAREQEARRAHEQLLRRPLWESAAGLALESARLASAVLVVPLRLAAALLSRRAHAHA